MATLQLSLRKKKYTFPLSLSSHNAVILYRQRCGLPLASGFEQDTKYQNT